MSDQAESAKPNLVLGLRVTPGRRLAFFLLADASIIVASIVASFSLRLGVVIPEGFWTEVAALSAIAVASNLSFLAALGVYRVSWSFVGLRDIAYVGLACVIATAVLSGVAVFLHGHSPFTTFPRSVVLIQLPIAFVALTAFRLSRRFVRLATKRGGFSANASPTLLVGVGQAGEQVLASIQETGLRSAYEVVGFLDDDPLAHGTKIHGVPVVGGIRDLEKIVNRYGVEIVILCIEAADRRLITSIAGRARAVGVRDVRIIPAISQIVTGRLTFQATREVGFEDLLGRQPVDMGVKDAGRFLRGERVLITGGAGTIGAELCRQVAHQSPKRLIVLDNDETRLHEITQEIEETCPMVQVEAALADIRDSKQLEALFREHKPTLVFHAAAYKHVGMMEKRPIPALHVNVVGTLNVLAACRNHGTQRFVLVSTDKAVEPTSVMGASKRLAELCSLGERGAPGSPVRVAVRFGNVIGSRGSVITIFERQLRAGGPLTVTHPDVERFFMMTSEAVALVIQAAAMGRDGDLFVLDMGVPVRILDVAREFIRLQGLRPDVDIPIRIIGLRPGEKMVEVVHYPDEALEPTSHRKIRKTRVASQRPNLAPAVALIVANNDAAAAADLLRREFPTLTGLSALAPPPLART